MLGSKPLLTCVNNKLIIFVNKRLITCKKLNYLHVRKESGVNNSKLPTPVNLGVGNEIGNCSGRRRSS